VYFDAQSRDRAQRLCATAGQILGVSEGCTLDRSDHIRAQLPACLLIPWPITHRGGLPVFAHALTCDDLKDHADYVVWLGPTEPLNLSALR